MLSLFRHKARDPKPQQGAVLLITVIMVGSLLLIMGLSAAYIGQTSMIITGQMDRGQHALTLASSCMEEAMQRLKQDTGYIGGTVSVGSNTCSISISGTGQSRTIVSTASSADFSRTIEVVASLNQNIDTTAQHWNIDSWRFVNP